MGPAPTGRPLADRDVVLWCNAGAGGAPDPEGLMARLRACGRHVQLGDPERDASLPDPLAELVLVAGGDGTVSKAARLLSRSGVPMAILPSGTANNIAASLGVAQTDDPIRALSGDLRSIDLGLAQGPWGDRIFLESLGIGALASAERTVHEAAERRGGYGAEGKIEEGRRAIAAVLARPSAVEGLVRPPGGDVLPQGPLVFVEVCNVGRIGPALLLVPDADASDGAFDVVLGDLAAARSLRRACEAGGFPARAEPRLPARLWRRIELACRLQDLRIDGTFGTEIMDAHPNDERCHDVTVEVLPGALWVVAPDASRSGGVGGDAGRSR